MKILETLKNYWLRFTTPKEVVKSEVKERPINTNISRQKYSELEISETLFGLMPDDFIRIDKSKEKK